MKTNRLIYLLAACFIGGLLILQIGCKKVAQEPEENPFSELAENTKVINPTDWQDSFVSLDSSDYTITFNNNIDAMNLKVGDIIVSAEGDGLLRKVTGITTDQEILEVKTEQADLEDAIRDGEVNFKEQLTISKIESINYHYKGISLDTSGLKQMDNTNFVWDINTVLFDADENDSTIWDQIRLEGQLSCSWNLEMSIQYSFWSGLKKVKCGFVSSENLNLELVVGLEYMLEESVDLMTINFNNIVVYVAGCPVVFKPVLTLTAGVDVYANANISTSITQEMSFNAGIKYEKGDGWSPYNSFNKTFTFDPPQLNINAGAEAYIGPELMIKIYGVDGPYTNLKLYAKLDADVFQTPWWTLKGGLDLSAGAKARIFGKNLFNKHYAGLISYEDIIAQSSVPPPVLAVSTADISNITLTSATGGGNVLSQGGSEVTTRGVCWSTSQNPTIADNKTVDGSGLGTFTSNITDLSLNTKYFVRAYATNSESEAYGSQKSFTTGPVAWFPFDGDFNDQSGNNYNGTNMNATWTTDRDGNPDQALLFNGNSSGVILSNGYPPVFNGSLTVSMWVYFNDNSRAILMGSYNTSHSVNFEKGTSNQLRIYWNSGQPNFLTSNNVVSQNTWHFVTFVRDKELDKFIIYVDGNEVGNMSNTGSDITPTGPFRIGRDSRTGSTVTNGKIDDVRIYSRALSAEEILELFNY